jgi:hypothetical protein
MGILPFRSCKAGPFLGGRCIRQSEMLSFPGIQRFWCRFAGYTPFKQTFCEVKAAHPDQELVFWNTLVWKDKTQADGISSQDVCRRAHLSEFLHLERATVSEPNRRKTTLDRAETMVQAMIWNAARKLKNPVEFPETGSTANSENW